MTKGITSLRSSGDSGKKFLRCPEAGALPIGRSLQLWLISERGHSGRPYGLPAVPLSTVSCTIRHSPIFGACQSYMLGSDFGRVRTASNPADAVRRLGVEIYRPLSKPAQAVQMCVLSLDPKTL